MIFILPTDTCYGIACPLHDKNSYEQIYKIKKRSLEKPMAILVESFDWIKENTTLNQEQIEFLRNYPRPFTILTQSTYISLFLNYQDEKEQYLINKDIYEELSFRVSHNDVQDMLIQTHGPLWMTSANISRQWEIYTPEEVEEDFWYYLKNGQIELLGSYYLDEDNKASDVFRFIWDSCEVDYVRRF